MATRMRSPIRGGNVSPIRGGSVSPIDRGHTPTASDFPVPANQDFRVKRRDKGLVSPSQSSFSFIDEEDQPMHAITTPHRVQSRAPSRVASRGPSRKGSVDLSRSRGASVDGAAGYMCTGTSDTEQLELRKNRSQFFTEVFAYKEPNITPKDRIYKDAIVTVEVKTNVIVHDEYELLQDLSQQLSQRFQRPTSSIFIYLSHSACMLFGGTFDSAYILTITALPCLLQPTTNKRNAALLQAFLADSLNVSPARGIVRFMAVPDEYLAFNGTTVNGQIDNLQKEIDEQAKEAMRPAVTVVTAPIQKKHSQKQYKMIPNHTSPWDGSRSVPLSRVGSPPTLPTVPVEKSLWEKRSGKAQRLRKRSGFFNMFGRKDIGCG